MGKRSDRRFLIAGSALVAGLALLVFSRTLASSGFIRDDRYIITDNPLLLSWNSIPQLVRSGYWESALGSQAPVQEFRPILMLSYLFNLRTLGAVPWHFHLINMLLHAANALLLFWLFRRHYPNQTALASAAIFAVLPVHVEAVAYISGRSELLVCFFLLLTWLELDKPNADPRLASIPFLMALFSKEQAVLFPIVLAMQDWSFRRKPFQDAKRRRIYAWLLSCVVLYFCVRIAVLNRPFHGGADYFREMPYYVRLLTMPRFALAHYLWPAVTGLGLQAEFIRPFFPDSGLGDPWGWLALAAAASFAGFAAWRFRAGRSRWAFWALSGFLWLLPVSNLVIRLDTIGAERFLYLPSLGLCVLLAQSLEWLIPKPRFATAAFVLLVAWYGILSFQRDEVWASELSYYRTSIRDNPLAPGAHSGLGVALLEAGEKEEAAKEFQAAIQVRPSFLPAYYNLGRMEYEAGHWEQAEWLFKRALGPSQDSADAWTFLGLVDEKRGRLKDAIEDDQKSLAIQPAGFRVYFNLGRLYLQTGQPALAREQFQHYLELAPSDPDAPAIRAFLSSRAE